MLRLFTLLAFIGCSFFSVGQDISGQWTGFLDLTTEASKTPGYEAYYKNGLWEKGQVTHMLSVNFTVAGDKVTGQYHVYTRTDESHFGKFAIEGTFKSKSLAYKTVKKISEVSKPGFGFCFNKATLKYSIKDGYEYLEGPWSGWDDYGYKCASAWVVLRKKLEKPEVAKVVPKKPEPVVVKPEPVVAKPVVPVPTKPSLPKVTETRPVEIVGNPFITSEMTVEIEVFDGEKEDGDIVSLSLNDYWVLQNYEIRAARRRIVLDLVTGDNFLVLFAKNLGEIPPNTATIVINDGMQARRIILNSDLAKSQGFKIVKR